jgi:hypothetical protein
MKRASKPAITPEKFLAAQSSETQEIAKKASALHALILQAVDVAFMPKPLRDMLLRR